MKKHFSICIICVLALLVTVSLFFMSCNDEKVDDGKDSADKQTTEQEQTQDDEITDTANDTEADVTDTDGTGSDTETDTGASTDTDVGADTEADTGADTGVDTEAPTPPPHSHSYGEWTTVKDATCTENGSMKRVCSCGQEETKSIDALGHDEIHHKAKEPECESVGWDAYVTCSRCTYSTYAETPSLGHDLKFNPGREPTCTESGYNAYYTCSRCVYAAVLPSDIPPLGHDEIYHDAKEPTCKEIGWYAYVTCARCSYNTYEERATLEHTSTEAEQLPNCIAAGYKATYCSECWETLSNITLNALDHNYINGVCIRCGIRPEWIPNWKILDSSLSGELKHKTAYIKTYDDLTKYITENHLQDDNILNKYTAEYFVNNTLLIQTTVHQVGEKLYLYCDVSNNTLNIHLSYYNDRTWPEHGFASIVASNAYAIEIPNTLTDNIEAIFVYDSFWSYEIRKLLSQHTPPCQHILTTHDAKAPTCLDVGWDEYVTCSKCNYSTYRELPTTEHTMVGDTCTVCYYPCTPIRNAEDLKNIARFGSYVLLDDIDLGGAEWTPIEYFEGTFVGNGHKIYNFKITKFHEYAAFFGTNYGTITGLGLEDFVISFASDSTSYSEYSVGALVGYNSGTVIDCYATGEIRVSYGYSETYIGGLIGYNYRSHIKNCHAAVDITIPSGENTTSYYVGGLVGYSTGDLTNCYAEGDINLDASQSFTMIGGLIGAVNTEYNSKYSISITNCYATGSVTANNVKYCAAGGLVGQVISIVSNPPYHYITDCYATGNVEIHVIATSTSYQDCAGGLVGSLYSSVVTNCHATGNVTGTGTYQMDAGGLIGISVHPGSSATSFNIIKGSYATGHVSASAANAYAGGLIAYIGMRTDVSDCYATGNITAVSNPNITNKTVVAGGLIGLSDLTDAYVTNCYATGNVSVDFFNGNVNRFEEVAAGGLIGQVFGIIKNCYATGNVSCINQASAYYQIGGFVGNDYIGMIQTTKCYRYEGQEFYIKRDGKEVSQLSNSVGTALDMDIILSESFHYNTLGWSGEIWNIVDGQLPTLK